MWQNLLKTWLVELPILWLFLHKKDKFLSIVVIGALINVSTWTFLSYYYYQFGGNIYLLEILVAMVEAVWIRKLWPVSWLQSLKVSFLANTLSFGLAWWGFI
ncbi:hypothetical protein P1X15_29130 [Runella sp. MFBS21]|uniref:hypothetical protein n=1 Tax=Runella sp. MFBS21 TaxID=3034018 RepID=UPI0023F95977|nr:hypothetical protein [Runella sp. MFBS21]MDF7821716.1 hypothetical protein [Runella sp. MFBS21]